MSADKGNTKGMKNYGFMLKNGWDVFVNKEKASNYLKMSADKRNAERMYNYADMLDKSEGISVNNEEAIKYFKMTSDSGNFLARMKLNFF